MLLARLASSSLGIISMAGFDNWVPNTPKLMSTWCFSSLNTSFSFGRADFFLLSLDYEGFPEAWLRESLSVDLGEVIYGEIRIPLGI